jgi:hypothetical protein
MANTGKATKVPDENTTFDRLPNESDEPWQAFCIYRDLGPRIPGSGGRSMENVRLSLGKDESFISALKLWSSKFDWVKRARLHDDELERQNRKVAEKKIPYWASMRERSHRLNMVLARDIRLKIREMLKHPITVEEFKEVNGEQVVFMVPAKWTYNTVGNLAKIAAELEAGTISDALMTGADDEDFDPSTATIEQLRDYITRNTGKKPVIGSEP